MLRRPSRLASTAALSALVALLSTALPTLAQTVEQNDSSAREARQENGLPLITTRALDFTTDEGTWISLDLSPDESTIVFELLGDLYTIPVAGGEATRITSGQGYDMQPRYSPDGSTLVFVSDRDGSENVWLANADGSDPRQLTDGERQNYVSPEWTPDGSYIMVAKGTQQWLYHTDGGSGVQVTGHREADAPAPAAHFGAAFGADERYVWLNLRGNLGGGLSADGFVGSTSGLGLDQPDERLGAGGFGSDARLEMDLPPYGPDHTPRSSARQLGAFQIGVLDRETGRVFVRTHELEGAFRPMPSPDGRWLVYATRYDDREALKLRDLQSGAESWLVMDVQRDDSQGGGTRDRDVYPGGSWTSDSRSIITSYGGKIMRVDVPSGNATEVPFTARVQQGLGPLALFDYPINDSTLRVSQIRGARPSPGGDQIAFTALDRLWVANLPGASGTQTAGFPVLRDARRLTTATDVEHAPVWSPDGDYIAYVTWNDSIGGDIWRIQAAGGDPERLTTTSAFYDKIGYSADGARLFAVRGSKMHRMRTLEDFGSHSAAAELEYVWLPAEGGETERITYVGSGTTQQGRNAPHSGPDPERVYIWAGREGLLSMRLDGTDIRVVANVTAPGVNGTTTPDEVVLSPDGGTSDGPREPERLPCNRPPGGRGGTYGFGQQLVDHAHSTTHEGRRRLRRVARCFDRVLFDRTVLLRVRRADGRRLDLRLGRCGARRGIG